MVTSQPPGPWQDTASALFALTCPPLSLRPLHLGLRGAGRGDVPPGTMPVLLLHFPSVHGFVLLQEAAVTLFGLSPWLTPVIYRFL